MRGGATAGLEGGWQPKRLVVIEFDDADRAKAWHGSEIYAPAKALREASTNTPDDRGRGGLSGLRGAGREARREEH